MAITGYKTPRVNFSRNIRSEIDADALKLTFIENKHILELAVHWSGQLIDITFMHIKWMQRSEFEKASLNI